MRREGQLPFIYTDTQLEGGIDMLIKLSPQRRDGTLGVVRSGSILIANGEPFDFSRMSDGDTLPRSAIQSDWFAGDVDNIGGELELTLLLPIPANFSPEQAFPVDLVDVPNGPVVFPHPLPVPTMEEAEQVLADNEAGHFADEGATGV